MWKCSSKENFVHRMIGEQALLCFFCVFNNKTTKRSMLIDHI